MPNVNFFMSVPILPDGGAAIALGRSKAGDFVDLKAEMDVLAVISNCPQVHNPCNDFNPTPIRVVIWEPRGATSETTHAGGTRAGLWSRAGTD